MPKDTLHRTLNLERARKQHAVYKKAITELGLEVELFPPLPERPDGLFVDGLTVLLPEVAIIGQSTIITTRMKEMESTIKVLARHRPVQRIGESAELSGSDVLRIGHVLYVTLSKRTNAEGIASLREIVRPFEYEVKIAEVQGEKSLREVCSFIPPCFLVAHERWISPTIFGNMTYIHVPDNEPFGAATLTLGTTTLISSSCPETGKRLRAAGIAIRKVDISELEKVGGNLTRLSLIKEPRVGNSAAIGYEFKTVDTPQVPSGIGYAAQAIVHNGLVYVSAQLPFNPAVAKPPVLTLEEQTEYVLRNVSTVLHSAGSSLADVLRATVYLADPRHLERIDPTYARMFAGHRPARSVVENRALPPGVLVEIEVVAAVSKWRHL